jgi:putative sterol carrier protein
MRLQVGGQTLGVLVIDDGHLSLTEDDRPVDVTSICATRDDLVQLLRGELNPVVAALRGKIRQRGDRAFGAKVILGLRAGSPFVHTPFDAKDA